MRNHNRRGLEGSAGFGILEVLISLAILTTGVLMIYGVSTAASRASFSALPEETVLVAIQAVTDTLRNYVTADRSALTLDQAPNGSWKLPGDGSSCSAWALDAGCDHDATSFLPADFRTSRPKASLKYRVTRAAPPPPLTPEDMPSTISFTAEVP